MEKTSDLTTPDARLRWARQRAGYEHANQAAERFGWKDVTYRAHENGIRGFARHAETYSKAFKVPVDWLITGRGNPDAFISESTAALISIMPLLRERDQRELLEMARLKQRMADKD